MCLDLLKALLADVVLHLAGTLMDIIKPMVPKMVITPVKNWVKPIRRPSEN